MLAACLICGLAEAAVDSVDRVDGVDATNGGMPYVSQTNNFTPGRSGIELTSPVAAPWNALLPLIEGLIGTYGRAAQVIMILGALRLILKPAMSIWRTVVEMTASPKDDEELDAIEHSKAYHVIAYLLDWGASIKVGPRAR